tara:strand:- start:20 stop:520 length:501 start_codon:yes stop_codon:yes gene_type:complete
MAMKALMIASIAMSAAGMVMQGMQQSANLKFQGKMAERDAKIQEQNSIIAGQQGEQRQKRMEREGTRARGTALVGIGASGGQRTGSALDVLEDIALEEELSLASVGYETKLQQRGMQISAETSLAEASARRMQASAATRGAIMGAATQALSGATKVGMYQKMGMFS